MCLNLSYIGDATLPRLSHKFIREILAANISLSFAIKEDLVTEGMINKRRNEQVVEARKCLRG